MQKGEKVTPAIRQKLREGQWARYKRELRERVAEPDHKRCPKCTKVKPVAAFHTRKVVLRSGGVSVTPESWCKECKAKVNKKWREKKAANGELKAMMQRWYQNKDRDRRLENQRERETAKRREEGRPQRGPWKRNRRPEKTREDHDQQPNKPLAEFLLTIHKHRGVGAIAAAADTDEKTIWNIMKEVRPTVEARIVDKVLSGLGYPEMMHELYPDTTVGYHVLPG